MNNPPAQDQPVTPQAEEWSQKLYDVNSDFYYSNGAINFPKIIESFRQELKLFHANGVEEGKKLIVGEANKKLRTIPIYHYLVDNWHELKCWEIKDVLDILNSQKGKDEPK